MKTHGPTSQRRAHSVVIPFCVGVVFGTSGQLLGQEQCGGKGHGMDPPFPPHSWCCSAHYLVPATPEVPPLLDICHKLFSKDQQWRVPCRGRPLSRNGLSLHTVLYSSPRQFHQSQECLRQPCSGQGLETGLKMGSGKEVGSSVGSSRSVDSASRLVLSVGRFCGKKQKGKTKVFKVPVCKAIEGLSPVVEEGRLCGICGLFCSVFWEKKEASRPCGWLETWWGRPAQKGRRRCSGCEDPWLADLVILPFGVTTMVVYPSACGFDVIPTYSHTTILITDRFGGSERDPFSSQHTP